MKSNFDYSTYLSPFTTRYGSEEMRKIWSEENKRLLWRKIWVSLAKAENKTGLVSKKELDDIVAHQHEIDIPRAKEIEKEIYHEVMAEIRTFSEQCKIGGGKIHLGATSTDVLDNANMLQVIDSVALIEKQLKELLALFKEKIIAYQDVVCMGFTHLQPAEPTTLGYRLSFYAQDLLMDFELLQTVKQFLKGKGIKGAVGTSASYTELLKGKAFDAAELENSILKELNLPAVTVSGQTYPRKIDLLVSNLLSHIAASLHKFAFDYRVMQQPGIGEWVEKRDAKRVGSSAMPFKRNPDKAEKVCSLCRYVSSLVSVAWSNPAMSLLERTLDDSANQRIFLPESFLAIDECMKTVKSLLTNLEINHAAVNKNLQIFGQFSALEPILMKLTEKGASRQEMHELLKSRSMKVWQGRDSGENIDLLSLLIKEPVITALLSEKELSELSSPSSHIGLSKQRTKEFLKILQKNLS